MKATYYNAARLAARDMTPDHIVRLVRLWQRTHPPLEVDGKFGPQTRATLEAAARAEDPAPVEVEPEAGDPSALGLAALRWAAGRIGQGEEYANNAGPFVAFLFGREFNEAEPDDEIGNWCAAFVWTAIAHASAELGVACPVKRTGGARRLYRDAGKAGEFVDVPAPGDLVAFWRGDRDGWKGHIEIVESFDGSTLRTIGGNRGRYPSLVARFEYSNPWKSRKFLGLARLP
tara:strand:+ start:244 stop:936 length:693 start_codon:yes stop_codon:yes gene_type:complete